jgi:hypothetical protein
MNFTLIGRKFYAVTGRDNVEVNITDSWEDRDEIFEQLNAIALGLTELE